MVPSSWISIPALGLDSLPLSLQFSSTCYVLSCWFSSSSKSFIYFSTFFLFPQPYVQSKLRRNVHADDFLSWGEASSISSQPTLLFYSFTWLLSEYAQVLSKSHLIDKVTKHVLRKTQKHKIYVSTGSRNSFFEERHCVTNILQFLTCREVTWMKIKRSPTIHKKVSHKSEMQDLKKDGSCSKTVSFRHETNGLSFCPWK